MFKTRAGIPGKYRMRMRIMIPVKDVLRKLVVNKFARMDEKQLPVARARRDLTNFEHEEIITFYNHRISGLLNFYDFACNLNSLRKIIMFLHLSCALTLALKYKLRTKRQAFRKFGRSLTDPETGVALILPKSLKVRET